jgi:hypothetical protein
MTGREHNASRWTRRAALQAGAALGGALIGATAGRAPARAPPAGGQQIEPQAGTWKPWLLTSGSLFRPASPPDDGATQAELQQVKAMAGRRAAARDRIAYLAAVRSDLDDLTARWDGEVPVSPGLWTGMNPPGVVERNWKPFILPSADALRPPPPPAPDSEERTQEIAATWRPAGRSAGPSLP